MKIVKFDKSKGPTELTSALSDKHEIVDLSNVDKFR